MTTELTKAAQQALMACPFCGCDMRIESNRDWHKLHGNHAEGCVFSEDAPVMTVPATDCQLEVLVHDWNTRALTQRPAAQEVDEREEFEAWFDDYYDKACAEFGGIDCTDPKGIAEDAWKARASLPTQPAAQATPEPGLLKTFLAEADRAGITHLPPTFAADLATATPAQQAAGEPVGEQISRAEALRLINALIEGDTLPPSSLELLRELAHPAPGVPEDVQRNAARWEEVLRQVGADRQCGGFRFTLYNLRPIPGSEPMQGAVCQHFTQAVDAMLAAAQAKGGEHG